MPMWLQIVLICIGSACLLDVVLGWFFEHIL